MTTEILGTSATTKDKALPQRGGAYDRMSFPLWAKIETGQNTKYSRALDDANRELFSSLKPTLSLHPKYSRASTKFYLVGLKHLLHSFAHVASYPGKYDYVSLPLNPNGYHDSSDYGHLSYSAIRLLLDVMQEAHDLIQVNKGTYNRETGEGLWTRIGLNPTFKDWLVKQRLVLPKHPYGYTARPTSNPKPSLVVISSLDEDNERIYTAIEREFSPREQILIEANKRLKRLKIDIAYPDYAAYQASWNFKDGTSKLTGMIGNQLFRSFSEQDGSGGRLWGHWVQRCPKVIRPYLTFDRQPVYEGDYASMQMTLMYAIKGIDKPSGDLYDIGDDIRRFWMKTILTKTIGSSSKTQALGAIRKAMKVGQPDLMAEAEDLYEMFWNYHADVRDLLFSGGAWKKLQFVESEIALEVISMLLDRNITTIPMHDGFIVKKTFSQDLAEVMSIAYKKIRNELELR